MKLNSPLSFAAVALLGGPFGVFGQGDSKTCPVNSPLSCHSKPSPNTDSCCFLSPGGLLLQTQFWDTKPSTGPVDSWTIHGLWPDNCDGSFEQFCDHDRAYRNIREILTHFNKTDLIDYMGKFWKDFRGHDDDLWQHEWNKHGTCVNTLESRCYQNYAAQEEVVDYFQKAVDLFKSLNTYQVLQTYGISPDITKSYTLGEITQALTNVSGVTPSIRCRGGQLNEVWYFFNVRGSAQLGKYVPVHPDGDKSNCPSTGIKYLPKHPTSRPHPPTRPPGQAPGKPGPFSGRGMVKVSVSGQTRGCLIGSGQWYATGSCATYYAAAAEDDDGFTLRSSKGHCAVSRGSLRCNHAVKPGYVFKAISDTLTFYSDAVPRRFKKVTLYEDPDHRYELKVYWKGMTRDSAAKSSLDENDEQAPLHIQ